MAKHPKSGSRSLFINLGLIAVSFGLLALTIARNRGQIRQVISGHVDYRMFAVAFGLYMIALLCTFYRWYALVRVIEPRFTLRASYLLGFIGNLFNLVIPGAVGGDFMKAAYLVRMDINRTQAVASMVIDRILGLLGLFQLAGVAGFFAWGMASRDVRILIALVWCAVVAGYLVLASIFGQSLTRMFPRLLEGHSRRAGVLRELTVLSDTYRKRLGLVGLCLLASTLIHGLFVVAFYLVCLGIFHTGVPGLAQHLLVVPLTLFTTAVPLPFGALGLSEGIGDQLGKMVGHPGGALGMMGFRVLMYGGGIVCAIVYLLNIKQVRSLTEAGEELEIETIQGILDEPSEPDGPPFDDEPPTPDAPEQDAHA